MHSDHYLQSSVFESVNIIRSSPGPGHNFAGSLACDPSALLSKLNSCASIAAVMQDTPAMTGQESADKATADPKRLPPRFGLNAKALLMQAAALAAEEAADIEEHIPNVLSAHELQIAQLKSAFLLSSKLLTGVPKRETPIVAFVNTAKVRLAQLQRLPAIDLHEPVIGAG